MPLLLLFALMPTCLPIDWPDSPLGNGPIGGALFASLWTFAGLFAAWLISIRTRRRLRAPDADLHADDIGYRYGQLRLAYLIVTLFSFLGLTAILGWGHAVQSWLSWPEVDDLGRESLYYFPGAEFLILLPFAVVLVGSWLVFWSAEREFHTASGSSRIFWSRRAYVLFQSRQYVVLILTPLILLIVQQGIARTYPGFLDTTAAHVASLLLLPAFLIFFPAVLPVLLGLKPMPEGPTRTRLEANNARLGIRCRKILLWDTHSGVANAMVVGVLPRLRYMIFTDRLLSELEPEQIDGVLGHEAGHIYHRHILFYGLFMLLSIVLLGMFQQVVEREGWFPETTSYREWLLMLPVAGLAVYMFVAFGAISRRCERQADIFGCRSGSCGNFHCSGHDSDTEIVPGGKSLCQTGIRNFIDALAAVEHLNGAGRDRVRWRNAGLRGKVSFAFRLLTGWLYTWQHSSIRNRIAWLQRMEATPAIEPKFQKKVRRFEWAVVLVLIGIIGGLNWYYGWGILTESI